MIVQKMRCLSINLTKQDLYAENYTTLVKKIKHLRK